MAWNEILQAAVLGLQHSPHTPVYDGEATLPPHLKQEDLLLLSAVRHSLLIRGGYQPAAYTGEQIETSPAETQPFMPPSMQSLLEQWMALKDYDLICELLLRAADKQWVLAPAQLVALLRASETREVLRKAVAPVLGARGRWIVENNPAWKTLMAGESDDDKVWMEGKAKPRLTWLQRKRKTDPVAAREAVASVWKEENADFRLQMLVCLQYGLSAADLPFLQDTVKKEKAKEPLAALLRMIASLPESGVGDRMAQRALQVLRIKGTKLFGQKLEVTVPEEIPADWIADGIEVKNARTDKYAGVQQCLRLCSPALLEKHSGTPAATWLKQLSASADGFIFLEGLAGAAALHSATEWTEGIFRIYLQKPELYNKQLNDWQQAFTDHLPALLTVLGPERFAQSLAGLGTDADFMQWMECISALPFDPIPGKAALLIAKQFAAYRKTFGTQEYRYYQYPKTVAEKLVKHTAPDGLSALLREMESTGTGEAETRFAYPDNTLMTLHRRIAIYTSLTQSPS